MKDMSVVIVNHNTRSLCDQAVASVLRSADAVDVEVIVVDNSTNPDQTYSSKDRDVTVLLEIENNGFGSACNIGAGKASADTLLFLNPDTILEDGALQKAYKYFISSPNIGALGIHTVLEDGSLDHGCRRGFPTPARSIFYFTKLDKLFPKSRMFGGYRMTYLHEGETNGVDAVSGAFLMMSKQVFYEIGGFDEDYFMYGEDLDLCYRLKEKGYPVIYYADATMLHLKGQSGLCAKNPFVIGHFYHAMKLFYDKHYCGKYSFLVTLLVRFAISLKRRLALRRARNG